MRRTIVACIATSFTIQAMEESESWLPELLPLRSPREVAIDEQEELEELEAQLWEALMEQDA